jgi:hypothetical protein
VGRGTQKGFEVICRTPVGPKSQKLTNFRDSVASTMLPNQSFLPQESDVLSIKKIFNPGKKNPTRKK